MRNPRRQSEKVSQVNVGCPNLTTHAQTRLLGGKTVRQANPQNQFNELVLALQQQNLAYMFFKYRQRSFAGNNTVTKTEVIATGTSLHQKKQSSSSVYLFCKDTWDVLRPAKQNGKESHQGNVMQSIMESKSTYKFISTTKTSKTHKQNTAQYY